MWHAFRRQSGNRASSTDIEMIIPTWTKALVMFVEASVNGRMVSTRLRIARIADDPATVECAAPSEPPLKAKSSGTAPSRKRV